MQPPLVLDSVTRLSAADRDRVVIGASHCGLYPAYLAAKAGLRGVILHDAGVGRDRAGIAGLGYLGTIGMPAAAIDGSTARIGEGRDCASRGIISFVNGCAASLGCQPGDSASETAARLATAPTHRSDAPPAAESRYRLEGPWSERVAVWALDSASLAEPGDAGAILVTGSHGGLLGGDPVSALKVDAFAALFSDATGGIDDAGFSRLAALDRRGVAAATVDAMRARIGDGRSTYEDGVLTRVNQTAAGHGAKPGISARAFVTLLADIKLRSS